MEEETLRRFMATILSALMSAIISSDAHGLERYVIGGEESPWSAAWAQTGSISLIDISAASIQPLKLEPDQNIASGYKERGGFIASGGGFISPHILRIDWSVPDTDAFKAFDGDSTTALEQPFKRVGHVRRGGTLFDLGDQFPVNRIRFFPREEFSHRFLDRFELYINDGRPENIDPFERPILQKIWEERENTDVVVEIELSLQLVRFVAIKPWMNKPWEIAEFEIFGEGFVPKASFTSDIIDFGEIASWGRVKWSGTRDREAEVFIQTRSGMDDDPNVYWRRTGRGDEISNRKESGELLTFRDYKRLATLEKAGITYDTDNWSFWSAPYDFEDGLDGVPIISPGPRRYFQVRVNFVSTATDGAKLDLIGFDLSRPPAAREIVAEVFPLEVEPAKVTTFTYALRASIGPENPGFDSLEILTPLRVDVVRSVRLNEVDIPFTVEFLDEPTRFVVHFPEHRMDVSREGRLLEVIFDTAILRYGTTFVGRAFDSETAEVAQLISPGNATDRLYGDDISVRISLVGSLIASSDASPNPFTPNGDGINDKVEVSYNLLKLTGLAPVSVEIWDLSGSVVRRVYFGEDASGAYSVVWDGRDEQGDIVPPGMYLYRISVDTDRGGESRAGVIAVAY